MCSTRKLSGGRAGASDRANCRDCVNRTRIRVHAKYLVTLPEQIDQITPVPTAGVEDSHPGGDASAQELIEQVDVDLSELSLEIGHWAKIFCCKYQENIPRYFRCKSLFRQSCPVITPRQHGAPQRHVML